MTRKYRWYLALALTIALVAGAVAGCGGGSGSNQSGSQEAVLNVFNWSEYLPQEVIDAFTEETGIKVNYSTYSSQEEMVAKLEVGGSQYDLIVASDYMVEVLAKRGMLNEVDLSKVPNYKNMTPECIGQPYDPEDKYTVPYMWGTVAIAVNTDKVEKEITSWNDVWDPAFANQIVVLDDSRYIIGATLKSLGYSCNETDPARLDEAKTKLKELTPRIKAFDSDSPKTLFASNEVAIGIIWNGEAAIAGQENPAVKLIYPKEGAIRWQDNMAIPKGAKHPNNALLFMDYVCRADVGKQIAESFPYASPNAETIKLLPEELRNDPASYAPADVLALAEYLSDVGEATIAFDQIWSEVKS
ncbi:MAG: spermidine/putrescine ABC transporter substrate-binding protein [Desulforudis sp.]|jgi:spermidine/putrescine-binding protein|nr:spermidine/putrescine ABC transporter substrate-binding protein [Clostridia bacterium]RJX17876.1 MAG: spermidine/putrescine ABC transporter substrate-binding protein [Desulforudis sp.]